LFSTKKFRPETFDRERNALTVAALKMPPIFAFQDCSNMPVTPTKSWCDQVLADLNGDGGAPNKLIRIV